MTYYRILLLAWAAFLMFVGPAHAQTTERALAALCGPGSAYLAPMVEEAARRYLLHPVVVVAVVAKESRCRPHAIGRHGDTGLMQVRGRARNGLSKRALLDPRTNLHTGARWLAMMTAWCGSTTAGLGAYNTGKCGKGRRYARKVLAAVAKARKAGR